MQDHVRKKERHTIYYHYHLHYHHFSVISLPSADPHTRDMTTIPKPFTHAILKLTCHSVPYMLFISVPHCLSFVPVTSLPNTMNSTSSSILWVC